MGEMHASNIPQGCVSVWTLTRYQGIVDHGIDRLARECLDTQIVRLSKSRVWPFNGRVVVDHVIYIYGYIDTDMRCGHTAEIDFPFAPWPTPTPTHSSSIITSPLSLPLPSTPHSLANRPPLTLDERQHKVANRSQWMRLRRKRERWYSKIYLSTNVYIIFKPGPEAFSSAGRPLVRKYRTVAFVWSYYFIMDWL